MITTKNDYRGAGFDYTSEKCTAYGDYRISGEVMQHISVNGQYVKNDVTYPFTANRSEGGNMAMSGAPEEVFAEIAREVDIIIREVTASAFSELSDNE